MTDFDPNLATIIDPQKLHIASEAASEEAEAEANREFYRRWDRAGRRAFKGIMPRPWRLMMLKAALQRMERQAESDD